MGEPVRVKNESRREKNVEGFIPQASFFIQTIEDNRLTYYYHVEIHVNACRGEEDRFSESQSFFSLPLSL